LFILFLIAFSCFFVSALIAVLVSEPLFGVNLSQLAGEYNFEDEAVLSAMRFTQVINAIGLFLIPALIYSWLMKSSVKKIYGFDQSIDLRMLVLVLVLVLFALPVENFIGELNQKIHLPEALSQLEEMMRQMEKTAEKTTMAFLKMDGPTDLVLSLFIMAILPAVGEELLFRGVIQKLFSEQFRSPHLAIWVTAAIFSAIHMQFFGFFPRLIMGAALGYLFHWSGSLWYPIIAHFINNAMAVSIAYFIGLDQLPEHLDSAGSNAPGVFSLTLLVCLLIMYRIRTGFRAKKEPIT
jgi:membrane protease YdiL (CAAX protease family)